MKKVVEYVGQSRAEVWHSKKAGCIVVMYMTSKDGDSQWDSKSFTAVDYNSDPTHSALALEAAMKFAKDKAGDLQMEK